MAVGTATGQFGDTTRITRVGFADGWTGVVAIGVILYVAVAIVLLSTSLPATPAFELSRRLSHLPASTAAALLAIIAARSTTQPAARRTWKYSRRRLSSTTRAT